jgi:hypothetical protein
MIEMISEARRNRASFIRLGESGGDEDERTQTVAVLPLIMITSAQGGQQAQENSRFGQWRKRTFHYIISEVGQCPGFCAILCTGEDRYCKGDRLVLAKGAR